MKRPTLTLLCLIALVALAGCTSPDAAMKSFLGLHSSELVAQWGPPQDKTPDGDGGEVWSYSELRQWTTPGQANITVNGTRNSSGSIYGNPYGATYQGNSSVYGNATTTYTPSQTHSYTARRSFFINSGGVIYRYAWKGR